MTDRRTYNLFSTPRARRTDPETSHEAAKSVKNVRASHRKILFQLKEYGPMTDDQIYINVALHMSPSGARTRRAELVARRPPLVKDSLKFRIGKTGRKMILWDVV